MPGAEKQAEKEIAVNAMIFPMGFNSPIAGGTFPPFSQNDASMPLNVGIAGMTVSKDRKTRIATHALGSCIAVVLFDPVAHVGGLLHYMLPDASLNPEKARANPFHFADTGIPKLFRAAYRLGARRERIRVMVIGGARRIDQAGVFNIGRRNIAAAKSILRRNGIPIAHSHVGGALPRSVSLSIDSGDAAIRQLCPTNRPLAGPSGDLTHGGPLPREGGYRVTRPPGRHIFQ